MGMMPKASAAVLLALTALLASIPLHANASTWGPGVVLVRITGTIDQGTYYYIRDAVRLASAKHWPLIVYLDTPGGYLAAALKIVDLFDRSGVPVVAYAGGRWAVSAGTLLLLAAPKAYASRYTVIGSMQPVIITPGGLRPVNESKIINTLLKIIQVHCEVYGRNYTAARLFVVRNLNLDGLEAYRYHVIDGVADSLDELLMELNGSRVRLFDGKTVLVVTGGPVLFYRKPLSYRIISALSDPILASLLASLAMLVIFASLAYGHPGFAAIGVVLLLAALIGMGFSANTVSLLLILIGAALIALDAIYKPGFGAIGFAGLLALMLGVVTLPLGGSILVSPQVVEQLFYTLLAIGAAAAVATGITTYKVARVVKRAPVVRPEPIGLTGRAVDEIRPDKPGFIRVRGEYWKAVSRRGVIKPGEKVRVVSVEEDILVVERVEERSAG